MIKHKHVLVLNQKAKTLEAKSKVVAQVFVHCGLVHDDISLGSTFADISVSANKEHTTIWFKDNSDFGASLQENKLQASENFHIFCIFTRTNSPIHQYMDGCPILATR